MFVYYYLHVDRPFRESQHILLKLLDGISEAADIAYREGELLLSKVGPEGSPIAERVRLTSGTPLLVEGESIVPLSWEATGTPGLFPRLDAELRLASIGPRLSKLALQGSYQPPLGTLGRAVDRALLHRIAEATIKHFVDRIGAAIVGWPQELAEALG
jgi:hypothetical protein